MKITENFTIDELCYSATAEKLGIENEPNDQQIEALKELTVNILQPIRDFFGYPLKINSGFRCSELNKAVKGAPTSYHLATRGIAAADIDSNHVPLAVIFNYIKNNLDFQELIWEKGDKYNPDWVHVAFNSKGKNIKKILYVK